MTKANRTYKEYLDNLLSLLNADEEMPQEKVDQILHDAGYNSEELGKKFRTIADQAIANSPHNWRSRAAMEHAQARDSFQKASSTKPTLNHSDLIDAINSLVTGHNLKVGSAYRNLKDLTDEDLESMLRQLEYLVAQKSKYLDE